MQREQTYRPGDPGVGPPPGDPPSGGMGDLALMLWRQRGFMLAVFLVCFLALTAAALLLLDKTYTARASLLVRFDAAYAFDPVIGGAGASGGLAIEQIIQSELNILRADTLKRRTLESLGLRAVYPDLANAYVEAPQGEARERVMAQALKRITQNLSVSAAPAAANIDAAFEHERADVASRFLNELIRQYLRYRPEVLLATNPEGFRERREEYEARLAGASMALEQFLQANGIGDFVSYRTSLQQRQTEVDQALFAARADLEQKRAQLGALRTRIQQEPPEAEQFVEDASSGRLADLMMERTDLQSRYTEDSVPIQELDARIAELSAFLSSGGAEGAGTRRVGPNPVRQELQTNEALLTGETASLDRRVAELTRQKNELRDEQIKVQGLSPQYERLARDIASLQDTVNAIAGSQESDRAQRDLATGTLDNVSIIQPAVTPSEGSSLKRPAVAGAFIVSGFIALLSGLLRGLLYSGAGAEWAEFMRREAAARPPRRERAPRAVHAPRATRATRNGGNGEARYLDDSVSEPDPYAPPAQLPVLAVIERRAPMPAYG